MKIEYEIFRPSGNDTALVNGIDYSDNQKKIINNEIMKKHKNVEQVGFIRNNTYELQMAGGEFCGNATRSAVHKYLYGKEGNIHIVVNKDKKLEAGINKDGQAWTEIPIYHSSDWIEYLNKGIYLVKMDGMKTVVVKPSVANKYLKNKQNLKNEGMELIKKYGLEDSKAVGVMFCELLKEKIRINPIVWVRDADTLFYETACGSGSTAVGMVEAYEKQKGIEIDIIQPSEMDIKVSISFENNRINRVTIAGNVITDGIKHTLEV